MSHPIKTVAVIAPWVSLVVLVPVFNYGFRDSPVMVGPFSELWLGIGIVGYYVLVLTVGTFAMVRFGESGKNESSSVALGVGALTALPAVLLTTLFVVRPSRTEGFYGGLHLQMIVVAVTIAVLVLIVLVPVTSWPGLSAAAKAQVESKSLTYRPFAAWMLAVIGLISLGNTFIVRQELDDALFVVDDSGTPASYRDVGLLPLWHVLDGAPFVDIPETLGWEEPAEYDTWEIGLGLLAVKLGFALVIYDSVKSAIKRAQKSHATDKDASPA